MLQMCTGSVQDLLGGQHTAWGHVMPCTCAVRGPTWRCLGCCRQADVRDVLVNDARVAHCRGKDATMYGQE